jgi:hypothetical protein
VLKPELTAPGKVVLSARSSEATVWNQLPAFIDADGVHAVNLGTSMSAPYVAGAVALLLQFAPALTPEDTRALLVQAARADAFTARTYSVLPPGLPNAHWGHGKLDASAALHLLPIPSGTVTASARVLAAPARVSAAAGTRVPLLQLVLGADSVEAVHVRALVVDVTGDVSGSVIILDDADGDGTIDAGEAVIGTSPVSGGGSVTVETDGVIARNTTGAFIVAVELAGGTQHGARFALSLDADRSRIVGTLSGAENAWAQPPASVTSVTVAASVLAPDERWSLSENPVRSGRLIVSFAEPPRAAGVYTLAGTLVKDLELTQAGERAEWTLDNSDGSAVASGVYLLLVNFSDGAVTKKVMVLQAQ